jgi:hypothetical protein
MRVNKVISVFAAIVIAALATAGVPAAAENNLDGNGAGRVRVPLNLAVLIQDDVTQRVGNELGRTREFIRELPAGSRVMVGYVTSGSLQVRQEFTTDLESAARSLRLPVGNRAAAPYNPFVEVREALRKFPADGKNFNALLLVSDGLDVSRGFDPSTTVHSGDLNNAVREAQQRGVAVYTFYAPTPLTASSRTAANLGQSALNRLTKETGGRAFFQGTDFVSFDPYFRDFSRTLNRQFAGAI